jgi:hypothetical protein
MKLTRAAIVRKIQEIKRPGSFHKYRVTRFPIRIAVKGTAEMTNNIFDDSRLNTIPMDPMMHALGTMIIMIESSNFKKLNGRSAECISLGEIPA